MTSYARTIPAALDRFARQLPDHDALITDDRSFTAATLRDEVHRAAAALIALGIQPGDRVAIWSPNTWHWVVACLAIHHAGAAMVPLNTRYTAEEASDILARTAAPVLFVMGRFLGNDRAADLDRLLSTPCPHCGTSCESRSTRPTARGTSSWLAVLNPEPPMPCRRGPPPSRPTT